MAYYLSLGVGKKRREEKEEEERESGTE